MPNFLKDNTYHILDTSTALSWPSNARINCLTLYATGTNAAVAFLIAVGTPIFRFTLINHVSMGGTTTTPGTYNFVYSGVRFPTAWIPSTLTACSAWIHFE